MCDMATDISMVFEFFRKNQDNYAWATLGSLFLNIGLQMLLTFFQNRGKGIRRQCREQLYVLSLVKPGVDAWRVASDSVHETGHMMNARTELTATKTVELVTESIPGTVLQLAAIAKSGRSTSLNAAFSFIFCIFTASFTSSTMSWDWDRNKVNQSQRPDFYGFIPDGVGGKVAVFAALYLVSAFNLLTRSIACVLLYEWGGFQHIAVVLGWEIALYLAVKAARRDLWYWVPIEGATGVFASFMIRVIIKVVTDWTAVVQFRHPNEVGGVYFTLSLGITVALGIAAAKGFEPSGTVDDAMVGAEGLETIKWEKDTIMWIVKSSCIGLVLSYTGLLFAMKREYVWTFFSTDTSNEASCELFTKSQSDDLKFHILGINRHKWYAKCGEDVRAWLADRLPVWMEEQPEWFTTQKMSLIPDDMVEPEMLIRLRTIRGLELKRRQRIQENAEK